MNKVESSKLNSFCKAAVSAEIDRLKQLSFAELLNQQFTEKDICYKDYSIALLIEIEKMDLGALRVIVEARRRGFLVSYTVTIQEFSINELGQIVGSNYTDS